jgi:alcohol dehydrogenase, propanol-preferring
LKIEERPRPSPKAGEILVKVAGCGICHTDLGYIDHGVPTFRKPPLVLGHEAAGVVEETGAAVACLKPGDRVVLGNVFSCGLCDNCREGRSNVCESMVMMGNNVDGAFAEYVTVPAKDAFSLPPEVPLVEGAIIADAISTPFHAVVNRARMKPGDRVVVLGCGGLGINCVQIAASLGGVVIAVDRSDAKLEVARKLGAVDGINVRTEENIKKKIRSLTGGGADIVMECIGAPETLKLSADITRRGGRMVVVGFPIEEVSLNLGRLMYYEPEIIGAVGCRSVDFPKVINMVRIGKINLGAVVSGIFPLDRINEGLDQKRRGGNFRIIVSMP